MSAPFSGAMTASVAERSSINPTFLSIACSLQCDDDGMNLYIRVHTFIFFRASASDFVDRVQHGCYSVEERPIVGIRRREDGCTRAAEAAPRVLPSFRNWRARYRRARNRRGHLHPH